MERTSLFDYLLTVFVIKTKFLLLLLGGSCLRYDHNVKMAFVRLRSKKKKMGVPVPDPLGYVQCIWTKLLNGVIDVMAISTQQCHRLCQLPAPSLRGHYEVVTQSRDLAYSQ